MIKFCMMLLLLISQRMESKRYTLCPSARGTYSVVGNEQHNDVLEKNTIPLPAFPLSSFHFPSAPHSPAAHIISYTLASPLSSPELNIFCNNKSMKRRVLFSIQITKEKLKRGDLERYVNVKAGCLPCWSGLSFSQYSCMFDKS